MNQPPRQFTVFYGGPFPNLKVRSVLTLTSTAIRLHKLDQPNTPIFEADYTNIQKLRITLGDIHFQVADKSFNVRAISLLSFFRIRKQLRSVKTSIPTLKDYGWLYYVLFVAVLAFVTLAVLESLPKN